MNKEMERTLEALSKLYDVWEMIEYDADDGEEKVTAQKVIDRLIMANTEDLVNTYRKNKKSVYDVEKVFDETV